MNRALWQEAITEKACPAWPCPVCKKGTLALSKGSLRHEETVNSIKARDHDAWDPDWIEYIFTAWAECTHPQCVQKFAMAGKGGVSQFYDHERGEPDWGDLFTPLVCHPMPNFFILPDKCPDEVTQELHAAFSLFWSNREACAGRIRVALECLMNHIGVPKKKKTQKGKYFDLTLHQRIDAFAAGAPTAAPPLMALKWLGNTGSHDGAVSSNDLLDAFEIFEHSLGELIDQRSAKVARLAKTLTKKHRRKK